MKHCRICRAVAGDDARYCRSCYAVFPDDALSVDRTRSYAQSIRLGIQLVLVLGVAASLFIGWVSWNTAPGADQMAQSGAAGTRSGSGDESTAATVAAVEAADPSARRPRADKLLGAPVNTIDAAAVDRRGEHCAISQAVHNGGTRIIFPVELAFSFRDASGQTIGDSVRSVVQAILPAGERRGFTFDLPCPARFTRVNIASTSAQTGIAGSGTVQSVAQLIAGKPLVDVHQLHVAISIPHDLPVCRDMAPCQLLLRFNDSWTVAWFRRDPEDPDTLIASNPQLIASLQRGWDADIQLPLDAGTGVEKLKVTQAALRAPVSAGPWRNLIDSVKRLLGSKEG